MNAATPAKKQTPLAIVQTAEPQPITPPDGPGEWTIGQIIAALSRPLPKGVTSSRSQGGKTLTYIAWHHANRILDKYAPGWTWEITQTNLSDDRIFVTGKLTIPTSTGDVSREAIGTELLKDIKINTTTGEIAIKELAYGDPSSNAESMSFRRAAARFGLGLYLYDK